MKKLKDDKSQNKVEIRKKGIQKRGAYKKRFADELNKMKAIQKVKSAASSGNDCFLTPEQNISADPPPPRGRTGQRTF